MLPAQACPQSQLSDPHWSAALRGSPGGLVPLVGGSMRPGGRAGQGAAAAGGSREAPLGPARGSPTALLPPERSQDSTAVALSDSSSTQDFFSEPASSQEGSRRPCAEKRLPAPGSQAGLPGKDLPVATEERGTEP